MSQMEKSEVWDLTVRATYRYRVCFDGDYTLEEAIDLFNEGDFSDVIDTEELSAEAFDGK